eukprot:750549-Hanusia_phi.AAC.5
MDAGLMAPSEFAGSGDGGETTRRREDGEGLRGEHGRGKGLRARVQGDGSSLQAARSPRSRTDEKLKHTRQGEIPVSPLRQRIGDVARANRSRLTRAVESREKSLDQSGESSGWPLTGRQPDEASEQHWSDAVRRMHYLEQENRRKTFEKAKMMFETTPRKESKDAGKEAPILPKLQLGSVDRQKSISLDSLITPRGVNVARMQKLLSQDVSVDSQMSSDHLHSPGRKWPSPMKTARNFRELKPEEEKAVSTLVSRKTVRNAGADECWWVKYQLSSSLQTLTSINLHIKREVNEFLQDELVVTVVDQNIRLNSVILKCPETDCSEYFADTRSSLRDVSGLSRRDSMTKGMIQKLNKGLRDMLELEDEETAEDSCYWPEVNKTLGLVSKDDNPTESSARDICEGNCAEESHEDRISDVTGCKEYSASLHRLVTSTRQTAKASADPSKQEQREGADQAKTEMADCFDFNSFDQYSTFAF